MKWVMVFSLVVTIGGCFLSREDNMRLRELNQSIANYDSNIASVIRDVTAKNITIEKAITQINAISNDKKRALAEQLELEKQRAANRAYAISSIFTFLLSAGSFAAGQGWIKGKTASLIQSVQTAKDKFWPKDAVGNNPTERTTFNQILADAQGKALSTFVDKLKD